MNIPFFCQKFCYKYRHNFIKVETRCVIIILDYMWKLNVLQTDSQNRYKRKLWILLNPYDLTFTIIIRRKYSLLTVFLQFLERSKWISFISVSLSDGSFDQEMETSPKDRSEFVTERRGFRGRRTTFLRNGS